MAAECGREGKEEEEEEKEEEEKRREEKGGGDSRWLAAQLLLPGRLPPPSFPIRQGPSPVAIPSGQLREFRPCHTAITASDRKYYY